MSTKVFFIDSADAQYTSEEFSWLQQIFLNEGIFGDSAGTLGLAVSQRGAGANMSVDVATGNALVELTKTARTWKVLFMNNAVVNVPIANNTSGSNRVDAIVVRIDVDTTPNSLKSNIGTIEVVLGSGVSALSDGAITTALGSDGWIRLANVTVTNGDTDITTGQIADTRVAVKTNESMVLAPKTINFTVQASDPSTLVEGMVWYNSTNHTLNFYNNSTVKQLGSSQGLFNPLVATAQSTPNMTLAVTQGIVRFNGVKINYAGGNSGSFTAPVTSGHKRIDLLCIDKTGTLSIVQGTSTAGTPSAPNYPNGMFVICEVYLRNGATSIKNTDDSSNGYIYLDSRGFVVEPSSFMGTGEDGDLVVASGVTNIDLGGLAVVTKNYRKIAITGTGQVTFSNPHANGTIIRLKSQGDVDLTSSTIPNIDASGMGGAGGAGSVQAVTTPNAGGNGNVGAGILDTLTTHGGNGVTGGVIVTANNLYSFSEVTLSRNLLTLICGSGGGGGSGGADGNSQGVSGGDGGRGGGALQINCGGYLNFTSALGVSVAGKNGANGVNKSSTNGASATGAGGGGSGGTCYILYNKLTSASGTINSAGGTGGTGGTSTDTGGGGGGVTILGGAGGGGAGSYAGAGGNGGAQTNDTNGNVGSNAGGARAGGGGGSGGSSAYNSTAVRTGGAGGSAGASENALVVKNNYF